MTDDFENTHYADRMDDAFSRPGQNVAPLESVGAKVVEIHNLPRGAVKVEIKRDMGVVLRDVRTIASAAGDDFYYRWPAKSKRRDEQTGAIIETVEWIEGPTVKLTNAVARIYGNCFAGMTDTTDEGHSWVMTAQFIDFETGYVYRRQFRQRKTQNVGKKMDGGRAEDIVFQIGQSKAIRNVVANALSDIVDYGFEAAKEAIVSRITKNIDHYRMRILARLNELNVEPKRVERLVGRDSSKWLAPDIARIIAELQAIKDGLAHPDDMWPAPAILAGQSEPSSDRPKREDYQDKPSGTPQAASDKPPEETREKTAFEVQNAQVDECIDKAAAADIEMLERLDDEVAIYTEKHVREDLRAKWNAAYAARKEQLRTERLEKKAKAIDEPPSKKAPEPEKAPEQKAAAEPPQEGKAKPTAGNHANDNRIASWRQAGASDDLVTFLIEAYSDLGKATTVEDVSTLYDSIYPELEGNESLAEEWKQSCTDRMRAFSRGRR